MSHDGVQAYLKYQRKKVVADSLKIMFVANIFERASPLMSTNASILVDSVGPPSAELCRTVASFP
jgi:hypothetical protein